MDNAQSLVQVALEGITGLFVVWYIAEEFIEIRQHGFRAYVKQGWNWLDWTNIFLFLIAAYFKAMSASVSKVLLSGAPGAPRECAHAMQTPTS